MKLLDQYGYPIERIKGKPLINLLRILFNIDIGRTLRQNRTKEIQLRTWTNEDGSQTTTNANFKIKGEP